MQCNLARGNQEVILRLVFAKMSKFEMIERVPPP